MSRAAVSKSRADKKAQSAQPQVIAHEIIPGKYNDTDWNSMLEDDDGDEFINDIVEELCGNVMDTLYSRYIDSQVLPFTICEARDAILQIIEWQFLPHDEEDLAAVSATWEEDEEPVPALTDCWAQGIVPKQVIQTPRTPVIVEEVVPSPTSVTEQVPDSTLEPQPERLLSTEQAEEAHNKATPHVPEPANSKITKKKQTTRTLENLEPRHAFEDLAEPPIEEHNQQEETRDNQILPPQNSIVKAQQGRPPGEKDVIYDEYGNVVSIKRIEPGRLPSHRVKVSYTIVDPSVEAAKSRLSDMKTGKYKYTAKSSTRKLQNSHRLRLLEATGTARPPETIKGSQSVQQLPPPLIEAMEISPGVTVKEGSRTKKGPKLKPKYKDTLRYEGLRPVGIYRQMPSIQVAELLDHQTPILKALTPSPPIPPISPQLS